MALYSCPNCGKPVSSSATSCPNCGTPLSGTSSELLPIAPVSLSPSERHTEHSVPRVPVNKKLFVIGGILVVLAAVFFFANRLTPEEKYQISQVEERIRSIGEVQLYSGSAIQDAQDTFDALTTKCQRNVKNKKVLSDSYDTWNYLKAAYVSEQINAIGEITLNSTISLQLAENCYNALTDEQKALVSNSNLISEAKEQLSALRIERVESLIDSIGSITVDSETKQKISSAQQYYNDTLTSEEQERVQNYSVLQSAYRQYGDLAVQNCIVQINNIGKVSLASEDLIENATNARILVWNEYASQITNLDLYLQSKKEFEALKAAEIERQKALSAGQTFTTSKWSISYSRSRLSSRILPNNTSGYYYYYACDDDSIYVDLIFKIKNITSETLHVKNLVQAASIMYDNKHISSTYTLYSSSGRSVDLIRSNDVLDSLYSTTLHIVFKLPRDSKDTSLPIKVSLMIDNVEKNITVR